MDKTVAPGKESPELKEKLNLLLSDIDKVFPDKTIIWPRWNHERWDKAAGYLCSQLGYAKGSAFLEAYGYSILAEEPKQKQSVETKEVKERAVKPAKTAVKPAVEEETSERRRDDKYNIPIWEKYALTVQEAAAYYRVGENKLRQIVADNPTAEYLLWNGNRPQFKRKKFENYLDTQSEV